jgi:hypothetical protein
MLQVDMQLVPARSHKTGNPVVQPDLRYVPILLDRAGERAALAGLPSFVWERTTPFIRVAPATQVERSQRVAALGEWIAALGAAVGSHRIYLDPNGIQAASNPKESPILTATYEAARSAGIAFMPVHTLGVRATAGPASTAAAKDGRGLALRYLAASQMAIGARRLSEMVGAEVQSLGVEFRQIDLFVDLGWIRPRDDLDGADLAPLIAEIKRLGPWRSIALAGTCVPETLAGYREGIISPIPRREREMWLALQAAGHLDLVFSDYGIQNPKPPVIGVAPLMRAAIRYSTPKAILVSRGDSILRGLSQAEQEHEYQAVCERLFLHDLYVEDCCPGDRVIRDCSDGHLKIRTQRDWRNIGTAHHAHSVVYDLQRLEAERAASRHAAERTGVSRSRRRRTRIPGSPSNTPARSPT